jgi:four helix bundle protein
LLPICSIMAYAEFYRDLEVSKTAQSLQQAVFEISKGFTSEEKYSLTDQIRRSSRSVGAQIAELWAKRKYKKHFISKLTDASGELFETQNWILTAVKCNYLPQELAYGLLEKYEALNKMINSIINKSGRFCD